MPPLPREVWINVAQHLLPEYPEEEDEAEEQQRIDNGKALTLMCRESMEAGRSLLSTIQRAQKRSWWEDDQRVTNGHHGLFKLMRRLSKLRWLAEGTRILDIDIHSRSKEVEELSVSRSELRRTLEIIVNLTPGVSHLRIEHDSKSLFSPNVASALETLSNLRTLRLFNTSDLSKKTASGRLNLSAFSRLRRLELGEDASQFVYVEENNPPPLHHIFVVPTNGSNRQHMGQLIPLFNLPTLREVHINSTKLLEEILADPIASASVGRWTVLYLWGGDFVWHFRLTEALQTALLRSNLSQLGIFGHLLPLEAIPPKLQRLNVGYLSAKDKEELGGITGWISAFARECSWAVPKDLTIGINLSSSTDDVHQLIRDIRETRWTTLLGPNLSSLQVDFYIESDPAVMLGFRIQEAHETSALEMSFSRSFRGRLKLNR